MEDSYSMTPSINTVAIKSTFKASQKINETGTHGI
jgi:hypothetical protein